MALEYRPGTSTEMLTLEFRSSGDPRVGAEIERRKRRDAGDRSAMSDREYRIQLNKQNNWAY